jgi:NAD(P)-dependent dehydrogenase (short-subunit alcohol dehydrogenase family)
MTTIAIVGAGPGLGAAVARRFGAEGFDIALISRHQERVDALAADLASTGLTARGYAASVREPDVLTCVLQRAADDLGTIEVLQYSPLPQREFPRAVLDTTVADLTGAVEFSMAPSLRCSRSCAACENWAGEHFCSSTVAAVRDQTRRLPAPPSPSPAKGRTR